MKESKSKPFKINWFKFYPSDLLLEIMDMPDQAIGKRIRLFLKRLMENSAPNGTLEARLLDEAKAFSDMKRQAVIQRWMRSRNREPEEEPPRERPQRNRPTPRPPKIPPSPVMEQNPEKFR